MKKAWNLIWKNVRMNVILVWIYLRLILKLIMKVPKKMIGSKHSVFLPQIVKRVRSMQVSLAHKLTSGFLTQNSVLNLYLLYKLTSTPNILKTICPVGWGCRIHWLHLYRGIRPPPTSVLIMTLNNLMVSFQWCWSFGECGTPLHCHCSLVHSGPEC